MQISDLDFNYPEGLVATERKLPTRIAFFKSQQPPKELSLSQLIDMFKPGDLLVLNNSKVIPARIFSDQEVEVLFLNELSPSTWQVLFPARDFKLGQVIALPGDLKIKLLQKGIPQIVEVSQPLDLEYFEKFGEVALPPYIQEARGQRHNQKGDRQSYQAAWAKIPGSVAAPTASLHFASEHLNTLQTKGVNIAYLTLHVGAGTFLPIRSTNLDDHQMHEEYVHIPRATIDLLEQTKATGGKVWSLGTTVTRSLEAWALGQFTKNLEGGVSGKTKLFIKPHFEFKVVDVLLTNFHQPRSTLLSLVGTFYGLEQVKDAYAWAIAQKFRLFSYGDLSVWIK